MKLGLIVEDEDEDKQSAISKLVSKICTQAGYPIDVSRERVKGSRGFGNINANPQRYTNLLLNAGAEIIVIVVDNDRNPLNARLKSLRDKISQVNIPIPVVVGVAVESIEAWLLADEGALNSTLGTTQVSQLPSKIKHPDRKLVEIIKHYGNQPVLSGLYGEIADKANKGVLDTRCKSFKRFHDELKNCLRRTEAPTT